jgi:hypothetical protein
MRDTIEGDLPYAKSGEYCEMLLRQPGLYDSPGMAGRFLLGTIGYAMTKFAAGGLVNIPSGRLLLTDQL